MRKFTKKMAVLAAFIGCAFTLQAAHLSEKLTFSARMNGAQEVPATTSTGNGVATMVLNGNRDSLCVTIYMSGFTDAVTGIHIHDGIAGTNGPVLLNLMPFLNGYQVQTVITGSALTTTLIQSMLEGKLYINAHTATNPSGEIRGQIKLEKDYAFRAYIDGSQEIPAVSTSALGTSAINVSLDGKTLNIWATVTGLSGAITGVHLHYGDATTNGPVIINLMPNLTANTVQGTIDISAMPAVLDSLIAEKLYINFHTAANPGGEIRGNFNYEKKIAFDTYLTGTAEVTPPSILTAKGTGYFALSNIFDQMTYEIVVDGLTGPIMGAHIHFGDPGIDGPVVIDLSSSVSGNYIGGLLTSTQLTPSVIEAFLQGEYYVNVHTTANPTGELRGQIYRTAREGYSVNFTGAQEVPAVTTGAYGGGVVTMDRNQSNLHIMLAVKGLSGPITGAHFHDGAAGTNGPVFYNITSNFAGIGPDDAAYFYYTAADGFVAPQPLNVRNGLVYVNLHTLANPNGEIRGQINRGSECANIEAAGVNELENANVSVYPNPFDSKVTVTFDSNEANNTLTITTITGQVIKTINTTNNNIEISLEEVPAGIYFVVLNNTQGAVKIVKR